ncbi:MULTISPECIES: alpha/beta hydrolase [Staphylococcus]|uniref:alpha/beta hydrolase n=1 Tax=Staphylococcus TaxID=1279 RepID=UPI000DF728E4|nr:MULTISPECIES: alpha/beta fold hydrolase [unclassified Staphylococcus]UXV35435.1 alpha/beta hydrolase [Staphylococcus sp. IVB6181]
MSDINYISSFDDVNLYSKITLGERPIANLIIVQGLTEDLDDYDSVASFFNEYDYNVIRYDQRGHGNTPGEEKLLDHVDVVIEDLKAVVDYVKDNLHGKVFILGHGVGGTIATLFGIRYPHQVYGYISAGGLSPTGQPVFRDDAVDQSVELQSHGREENLKKHMMIKTFREAVRKMDIEFSKFDDRVLIMHGGSDRVVSSDDAIEFFKKSKTTHKALRIYDGLDHELLNVSSYRGMLLSDIVNWLEFEMSMDEAAK